MVNDQGILYTMEGITAGILMVLTAYLIFSTTSIYTPGESHISEMQLEQLGNDVLAVMDTPRHDGIPSPLETYIESNNSVAFREDFLTLAETKANFEHWNWSEDIKFTASVYFRRDNIIDHYPYSDSGNNTGNLTGSEHLVMVTRRVLVTDAQNVSLNQGTMGFTPVNRSQSVLLEVLMWRD